MKAGSDYTLSYTGADGKSTSPVDAGTYKVTATGTGNYAGTVTGGFQITKMPVSIISANVEDKAYNGTDKATVRAMTLSDGTRLTGDQVSAKFSDKTPERTKRSP
ncbi:MBG domain-containing protein [Bifidobacterium breve]|uniref:MBG domain-containing protein n=1 Tax=Bifidobacterium breve TaxID=1685 RepID=UPI0032DE6610